MKRVLFVYGKELYITVTVTLTVTVTIAVVNTITLQVLLYLLYEDKLIFAHG